MQKKYSMLKNGGIYQFKSASTQNQVNGLITLLKLSGNKNPSNFSYISNIATTKYEDTSVRSFIFSEHTLDIEGQEIKNLFKHKDCMHLYDLVSNKVSDVHNLKYHSEENLFLFSLVKALLHSANRTLFIELKDKSISEINLKRIQSILNYEVKNKKRLVIISCASNLFAQDTFDAIINRDQKGKYSIDPMQPEINATKYVA